MRFVLNTLIKVGLLWVFINVLEWFSITHVPTITADPKVNMWLTVLLLAVFWTVINRVMFVLWAILTAATLGAGCLVLPVILVMIGPITFWAFNQVLPGWVDSSHMNQLQQIAAGIALSFIGIPSGKASVTVTSVGRTG